jgi:hypothetical protein
MPAVGNYQRDKGYDTDAALTKFRAVKAGASAESVTPCTVLGEAGIGISQFAVSAAELAKGKGASIREDGTTEWEASAAISRGADVTVAADGRCVTAAATQRVWGVARQAASGAGVRIAVDLAIVKYIKA